MKILETAVEIIILVIAFIAIGMIANVFLLGTSWQFIERGF